MLFQAFTPNYSKVNEYMDFKHFNCIVVFNKEKDSVLFCKRMKEAFLPERLFQDLRHMTKEFSTGLHISGS